MSKKQLTLKVEVTKDMFEDFTGKKISTSNWNDFVQSEYFQVGEKTYDMLLEFAVEDYKSYQEDNELTTTKENNKSNIQVHHFSKT